MFLKGSLELVKRNIFFLFELVSDVCICFCVCRVCVDTYMWIYVWASGVCVHVYMGAQLWGCCRALTTLSFVVTGSSWLSLLIYIFLEKHSFRPNCNMCAVEQSHLWLFSICSVSGAIFCFRFPNFVCLSFSWLLASLFFILFFSFFKEPTFGFIYWSNHFLFFKSFLL